METNTEDNKVTMCICPFCNGEEFYDIEQETEPRGHRIMCRICGGLGPLAVTTETAVDAWNGALKDENMTVQ